MRALAVDLEALAETRALWHAWLEHAARRYASIAGLEPEALPDDRGVAAARLDEWAAHGIGDWRAALERFGEDHVPLYVRRDASVAVAVRALSARGVAIGVFTDAPEPLARVVLEHVGARRRVAAVETGTGSLERLVDRLDGDDTRVVRTRPELLRLAQ